MRAFSSVLVHALKAASSLSCTNGHSGSELCARWLPERTPEKTRFLRNQLHKGAEPEPDGRGASSQPGRYSWDSRSLLPAGLANQINQLADVSAANSANNTTIGV